MQRLAGMKSNSSTDVAHVDGATEGLCHVVRPAGSDPITPIFNPMVDFKG
jgi:hypothetical protein